MSAVPTAMPAASAARDTGAFRWVEAPRLRQAAGRFVTGVAVVTANDGHGVPVGATVNAVTCLSLDPPLYLVCLANTSNTLAAILDSNAFAINVLAAGQRPIAEVFASKSADKFSGVEYTAQDGCAPLIRSTVAGIACRLWAHYPGGDHTILVGAAGTAEFSEEEPLVMRAGKFMRVLAP